MMKKVLISKPFELKILGYKETLCPKCNQIKECVDGINIDFNDVIMCLDCVEKKYNLSLHDKERKKYTITKEEKQNDRCK